MGRDVIGVCVGNKPCPVKVMHDGVSHDVDHESNSKVSGENTEVRYHQGKEAEKHDEGSTKVEDIKSTSPHKPASGPTTVGNVQIKNPVQDTCDVENDKLVHVSPVAAETPVSGHGSPYSAGSPTSLKKSQHESPFVPRKLVDDDDNWSLASSTATTRSRTTVPVAPTFKSVERLEKRKEFYAKLEEKHRALEAERREYEARTKEEEEAAIKQLRKSMVVKANPIPRFYYEDPPPKKELRKLPTTRAKSPRIGRRRSFGDVAKSSAEDKGVRPRALRHSLGALKKEGSTPTAIVSWKRDADGGPPEANEHSSGAEEAARAVTNEQ